MQTSVPWLMGPNAAGPRPCENQGDCKANCSSKRKVCMPTIGAMACESRCTGRGPFDELDRENQVSVGESKQTLSLQGTARLRLWAPWVLPSLHVKAQQFDLAALLDTLPHSALTGAVGGIPGQKPCRLGRICAMACLASGPLRDCLFGS